MFCSLPRILRRISWEWGNIWTFWLTWDLRLICGFQWSVLSFLGHYLSTIARSNCVLSFYKMTFPGKCSIIISYVIKHLCEGISDLKLEGVTWYEYKSNEFSHILGPKRTKKHSKRELRHYFILKIWGKQHIRNKGGQLSHSIFNKWWWCFSLAVVQGSLSSGVCEFILIHTHPFSLAPTCKRLQMCGKTDCSNWVQRGKTNSNPNVQYIPK